MATFSSVTKQHVLQALAEYDTRGGDEFLAVYGFAPSPEYRLNHDGRSYDAPAILGVAHRFATGRLATPDEFLSGMQSAVAILRKRGFDVTERSVPAHAAPARTARTTRSPAGRSTATRSPATRSTAARDTPPAICPTCSMTLPGTGICDTCS